MNSRDFRIGFFRYCLSLALLLGLLAVGTSCSGGEPGKPQNLSSYLPKASLPAGFDHEAGKTEYNRAKIWDFIGPNADVYLYNGFQNLLVARYDNGSGDTLTCAVFEFASPLEAFGLYSNLREFYYPSIDELGEGYLHGDTLTFLKGEILGRLFCPALNGADLTPAAAEMYKAIGSEVEKPADFAYFPDGYAPHSERVTLDDFLGQTELDDLRSAAYVVGSDTMRLYMHLHADNLLAEVVRAHMGGSGVVKEMIIDGYTQGFVAESEELGSLILKSRGPVLVMLIGEVDRAAADSLIRAAFAKVDELGLPDSAAAQK